MTDILDEVRAIALEQYKDEAQVDQFMEGFVEKAASSNLAQHFDLSKGLPGNETKAPTLGGSLAKGVGEQMGRSVVGAGATAAASGIMHLVRASQARKLYSAFIKSLTEATQMSKVLKSADKSRVVSYAHTVYKFAPHVATDSNMLSQILANAVHGDGIDPMTIRTLTELESRYMDTKAFRPKDYM